MIYMVSSVNKYVLAQRIWISLTNEWMAFDAMRQPKK